MSAGRVPFTWSWSRHRSLQRCARRYGFDYYGSRQGWRRSAAPRRRLLYTLKRLQTRGQWLGLMVHQLAEDSLKGRLQGQDAPPVDALTDRAARQAERALDGARRELWRLDPRKHPGFEDVYYGEAPVDDTEWTTLPAEAVELARALHAHPVYQRLHAVPERILEVEQMRRQYIGDVPIWLALDVLVDDGHGGRVVVDWKSGRHHTAEVTGRQLAVYALAERQRARRRRGPRAPIPRIHGLEALIRSGEHRRHTVDRTVAASARDLIRTSAEAMAALLPDPTSDKAPEEAFAPLPEGSPVCTTCRYREVCGRTGD